MLAGQLPLVLFWVYAGSSLGSVLISLAAAGRYDLKQINHERARRQHPHAKRYRHRPLVTIIVLAADNQATVERCLQSITQSSYRNYEVVVVDNGSQDDTKKYVKRFIDARRKQKLLLVQNRRPKSTKAALLGALERRKHGELVLPLAADCTLGHHTLRTLQHHFSKSEKLGAVTANLRSLPSQTIVSQLEQFLCALQAGCQKLGAGHQAQPDTLLNTVYQRDTFERLLRWEPSVRQRLRYGYASDAVITVPSATSPLGLLWLPRCPWLPLPLAAGRFALLLVEPFVLAYVFYLAVVFKNPLPLAVAWLLVSLRIAVALWGDEQLRLKSKLRLTSFIPMLFLFWCVRSFARVISLAITGLQKFHPAYSD